MMKTLLAILAFAILCVPCFAQQLVPTKAQYAKLSKLFARELKDATAMQRAQMKAARDQVLLSQACESVARENGWPDGTQCNPNNPAVFAAPRPAPQPAPPAKPDEKPKPEQPKSKPGGN